MKVYIVDNGGQWTHREWRVLKYLDVETKIVPNTTPFEELKDLDDTRHLVLGREMTKAFEQFIYGTPSEVISQLSVVKGEFALVVLPPEKDSPEDEDAD